MRAKAVCSWHTQCCCVNSLRRRLKKKESRAGGLRFRSDCSTALLCPAETCRLPTLLESPTPNYQHWTRPPSFCVELGFYKWILINHVPTLSCYPCFCSCRSLCPPARSAWNQPAFTQLRPPAPQRPLLPPAASPPPTNSSLPGAAGSPPSSALTPARVRRRCFWLAVPSALFLKPSSCVHARFKGPWRARGGGRLSTRSRKARWSSEPPAWGLNSWPAF